MNEQLADRVAAVLADGRAATVPELARTLRVRDAGVREVLRDDPRFACLPVQADRSTRARVWALVPRSSHSSPVQNGRGRTPEPFQASDASEARTPRSVGEAIRAANLRRTA